MTYSLAEAKSLERRPYRSGGDDSMDLLENASTNPFHTFDPIDGELTENLIMALESSANGDDEKLLKLFSDNKRLQERLDRESISTLTQRSDIPWDDATVLWIIARQIEDDGTPAWLDKGMARDKLGRFPWADGSPITYLLEFMIDDEDTGIKDLLLKLNLGLSEYTVGHDRYENGFGGLSLMGWLSEDEVDSMCKGLMHTSWGVSSVEPFDGGVREILKHLMVLLKSARAKSNGILLRKHS